MEKASELEQGLFAQIKLLEKIQELELEKGALLEKEEIDAAEKLQEKTRGLLVRVVKEEKRNQELAARLGSSDVSGPGSRLLELERKVRRLSNRAGELSRKNGKRLEDLMAGVSKEIRQAKTGKEAMAGYKKHAARGGPPEPGFKKKT